MYSHRLLPTKFGVKPNLDVPFSGSGYGSLPKNLTINSTTVSPAIWLEGEDATLTEWVDNENSNTFSIAGAGANPTLDDHAPGIGDSRVKFAGSTGKYYEASSSVADFGTDDFVFEATLSANNATEILFEKGSGSTDRVDIQGNAGGTFVTRLSSGATNIFAFSPSGLVNLHWYHLMVFGNRDGNVRMFVNGSGGAAVSISTLSSTTFGGTPTVGGASWVSAAMSGAFSHVAFWHSAGWLDTDNQFAVAEERFAKVSGLYPSKAIGTSEPTFNRAFAAYIDKEDSSGNRILIPVGSGWGRVVERPLLTGYLAEVQSTNGLTYSEDFTDSNWTKTNCTVSANVKVAPDGSLTGDAIVASVGAGNHYIQQGGPSTDEVHVFSCWVAPGDKEWVRLRTSSGTGADCYFHLSGNGSVGTQTAGVDLALIEKFGDWYRCSMGYDGLAPDHQHQLAPAEADGDTNFVGDGVTEDIYVWGAMHEKFSEYYPSSYIRTEGAIATRLSDQLTYDGDNVTEGTGQIEAKVLVTNADVQLDKYIASISDGGASSDHLSVYVDEANDYAVSESAKTSGNAGSTTVSEDVADGTVRKVKVKWATDNLALSVDGTQSTPDTSVDPPVNIDQIDVGQRYDNTLQLDGVISGLKVFKR